MKTFQKNLFYEQPHRDSKKGQYNPTPVGERRHSRRKGHTHYRLRFTDRNITQVAGYPMLEKAYDQLDLRQSFQRRLRQDRNKQIAHTESELSSWLVDQKMLGIERLYHADQYRKDPILCEHYGVEGLASDSTMSRYLRDFNDPDVTKIKKVSDQIKHAGLYTARQKAKQRREEGDQQEPLQVIIDIDPTKLTVYGKQENARQGHSKRKKDSLNYTQVTLFVAGCEIMLTQKLLPGNETLSGQMARYEKKAKLALSSGMEMAGLRVDSAGYSGENVKRWEANGYTYGASAQCTPHLQEKIEQLQDQHFVQYIKRRKDGEEEILARKVDDKQKPLEENEKVYAEVAEIEYTPSTWDHGPYTYLISRRKKGKDHTEQQENKVYEDFQWEYYAYITNYQGSLLEKFQFVVGRSNVERNIKESKIGFDGRYVPVDDFQGNQAYLEHVRIAYNILQIIKMGPVPEELSRHTRKRLAREIFLVPGELIKDGADWVIEVPSWWPYKKKLEEAWKSMMPPPCQN